MPLFFGVNSRGIGVEDIVTIQRDAYGNEIVREQEVLNFGIGQVVLNRTEEIIAAPPAYVSPAVMQPVYQPPVPAYYAPPAYVAPQPQPVYSQPAAVYRPPVAPSSVTIVEEVIVPAHHHRHHHHGRHHGHHHHHGW